MPARGASRVWLVLCAALAGALLLAMTTGRATVVVRIETPRTPQTEGASVAATGEANAPTTEGHPPAPAAAVVEPEPTPPPAPLVDTTTPLRDIEIHVPHGDGESSPTFAYVIVLSNDFYVDGALVLGRSLQERAAYVKEGKADLLCMIPQGKVDEAAIARLPAVGWRVVRTRDMSVHFPVGLKYRDSFNKLLIFALFQYQRLVFLDTDQMAVGNPDGLFHVGLPDADHVGAIGGFQKNGNYYWNTAMMLYQPDKTVFHKMMDRFNAGLANPDRNSELKHWMARDGSFLRNYFERRHVMISPEFSWACRAKHRSFASGKVVHFRGAFKPWESTKDVKRLNAHRVKHWMEATFGMPYREWWQVYDAIHREEVAAMSPAARDAFARGSGGADPNTQYWMQRTLKDGRAYTRETLHQETIRRNKHNPEAALVVGRAGLSCDQVCAERAVDGATVCDQRNFNFLFTSDEAVLRRAFVRPDASETPADVNLFYETREADTRNVAPYFDMNRNVIVRDLHIDPFWITTCGTKAAGLARLCPCVADAAKSAPVQAWDAGKAEDLKVVPLAGV